MARQVLDPTRRATTLISSPTQGFSRFRWRCHGARSTCCTDRRHRRRFVSGRRPSVLLALEERRHTGRGRHIDIAMSENLFAMTYWALATGFATDAWPGNGTDLVTGALPRYRVYPTRDRKGLVVAALEPKFWSGFLRSLAPRCLVPRRFDRPRKDDGRDCTHCRRRGFRVLGETLCRRGSLLLVRVGAVARREDPHFTARGVFAHSLANEHGDTMPALPVPIDAGFRQAADVVGKAPALGSTKSV